MQLKMEVLGHPGTRWYPQPSLMSVWGVLILLSTYSPTPQLSKVHGGVFHGFFSWNGLIVDKKFDYICLNF